MNKLPRKGAYLCLVVFLLASFNTNCFGYWDDGFQYWSTANVSTAINPDWDLAFEQEFRFGDEGGNLYYEHSDLGFIYKGLSDSIDLGVHFRLIYVKDSRDRRRPVKMPHLNMTFKGQLFGLDVSNRSRLEFLDLHKREDIWRYRNKTTAKFPLELTPLKLRPYVANESFINLDIEDFTRNRFFAGASCKLSKNVKLDIYYMWQAVKTSPEWNDINVLGTKLKFSF